MESRLAQERKKRKLSLAQVAEACDVDISTVSRWEHGVRPTDENIACLCEFFKMIPKELGLGGDSSLPQSTLFKKLIQDPIADLLNLAFAPLSPYAEVCLLVRRICEDVMSNPTRRDVLKGVLSGLILLPTPGIQKNEQWEPILQRCTVAIAACQELSAGNDTDGLTLAFNSTLAYLEVVRTIALESSYLRERALHLVANCAILKAELGWSYVDMATVIQYAQEAVYYSNEHYQETGDIALLLSACSKLAWAYHDAYSNKNALALDTALGSRDILERAQKEVHPCLYSGTYSTLALMQASRGIDADWALGRATEQDPGNEPIAMMDFTRARLPLEKALILCHQDKPTQAKEAVEEHIDPKTLIQKLPGNVWGRLEAINLLVLANLKSKDRDMNEIIRLWRVGIKEAKALQSEFRFAQSVELYQHIKLVFPEEQPVKALRDLLIHW